MKKSKSIKIKVFTIIFCIILYTFLFISQVFADVGSFESYDSGSSYSSGSSYDSSSYDWDSSSWDRDYNYNSSRRHRSGDYTSSEDLGGLEIISFIILVAILIISNRSKNKPVEPYTFSIPIKMSEMDIYSKIKEIDPNFDKDEFISWSKTLFVKLQQSWTNRDWEVIRTFETNELFEQHKSQLQGYINNNTINVMDRICVNYAKLYNFKQEGGKDILTVELNSRMKDYIIDATTKKVLQGDTFTERTNTYLLTFVRTTGVITQKATGEVATTNCPNCGAPTNITSSGKCEYCGSIIITDTFDWALSNLERKSY